MTDNQYKREKNKVLLLLAISAVFTLWFLGGLGLRLFFGEESGTIGDTFGAINALFTGLALVGVIVAIYYQKKELNETRKEFREQTKIHDAHLDMLMEQNKERKKLLEAEHAPSFILRKVHADVNNVLCANLTNAGSFIHDLKIISFSPENTTSCQLSDDVQLEKHKTIKIFWSLSQATREFIGTVSVDLEYKNPLYEKKKVRLSITQELNQRDQVFTHNTKVSHK